MIRILALLCALGFGTDVKIQDVEGREVVITAESPREGRAPTVCLKRRVIGMKSGVNYGEYRVFESWIEDLVARADETPERWTAEVRIKSPGRYTFQMGPETVQVGISRSGFDAWEQPLRELQLIVDKTIASAKLIDRKPFNVDAYAKIVEELNQERVKLQGLKSEFTYSEEVIRSGIDNLRYYQALVGLNADGTTAAAMPTALEQVSKLGDSLHKEATLILIDELLLLLSSGNEIRKVIRWPGRAEGFKAISAAAEKYKALPDFLQFLRQLPADFASKEDPAVIEYAIKTAGAIRAKHAR